MKKIQKFFSFPRLIIAAVLLVLIAFSSYYLIYLPSSISANVNYNYKVVENIYNQIQPLVTDLDARFNVNNLANSEYERINQDKSNLQKAISATDEANNHLMVANNPEARRFYESSKSYLTSTAGILGNYGSQIDFYKCIFGNINDQTNTWTGVVSDYTKINDKNPVDEKSQIAIKSLVANINKNSTLLDSLKNCYSGDKSQYLNDKINKILGDTKNTLNTISTGYQTILDSVNEKDSKVASDKFDLGLTKISSVNSSNLPLLDNINTLYSSAAKDFGSKEVEINNNFAIIKSSKSDLQAKFRF